MECNTSSLNHPGLVRSLQKAYSAERAAAFAYIGHAHSVKNPEYKKRIEQIEQDEWMHRAEVLKIMQEYKIPIRRFYEIKYYIIGKIISASCYLIGKFMPYFFAGKLESGNVCEYFVMIHAFRSLGIEKHDAILFHMGVKEKEHEDYFLSRVEHDTWLPRFEKLFGWGKNKSLNDVHLENLKSIEQSDTYCRLYKKK